MRLSFDGTLESFFFEQLGEAQDEEGTSLAEEVEAYLVNLLASYARRPQVAGRKSPPLATQYLAARQQGPTALREVGDRALYIAGVVPRSLDRTPVDVRYVAGIGEAAYREVHARASRLQVFEELADSLPEILAVLGRVLERGEESSNLMDLYERWRRSGDPRDARRLIAAGVLLDAKASDTLQ